MVRALQRSIFGRNWGASFCSITMARTPRSRRSMARVKPVGPAPTMRTCASIRWLLCSRLEIGEFGSFLHEIADRAFERLQPAVGGCAQGVLHLHRLKHDDRRPARQAGSGFGENARHRARHRRDDAARRRDLRYVRRARIDPVKPERPTQRATTEAAAGPGRRYPFERVAEAHVEHTTLTPHELQPIVLTTELQAQAAAAVPEHRVVPLGAVTKAQATAAAAGERPAV